MSPNEAFNFVMNHYSLSAQEISQKSGIHKSAISKFRNGKHQMSSDNLQKLVRALPPQARTHFNMLFSFGENQKKNDAQEISKINVS